MIYTVLMLPFITCITLLGTITSNKMSLATFQTAGRGRPVAVADSDPVTTFSFHYSLETEYEAPPTVTAEEGSIVQDWTIEKIEPRAVTVCRGKLRYRLEVGDSPGEGAPLAPRGPGIERHGDDVVLSAERRNDLSGPGLAKVLMQVAATQVPGVGFQLSQIDQGSIFDQVGFRENDVVMEVDGTALIDPWTAVQALRHVAALDSFTVKVLSADGPHLVTVRVR